MRCWPRTGSSKKHMLTATIWLADMADFAEMNAVWDAWLADGEAPGARDRRGEARHAGL